MAIHQTYQYEEVTGFRVGRFNFGINTTFVVYRIGHTLVDTGPSNQWKWVEKILNEKSIEQLILTHHHEDHSANAQAIADKLALVPYAPLQCEDKLTKGFRTPIWQKLIWGASNPVSIQPLPDELSVAEGLTLTPVFTPGHSKDLHCLYVKEKGWIFTGDLYLSRSIRYLRSDENLQLLIESIQKVLGLDFDIIFCAHRGIVTEGKVVLQEKLNNVVKLCQEAQRLSKENKRIKDIVKTLLGPEDHMAYITRMNFSKTNLIKEALKVSL